LIFDNVVIRFSARVSEERTFGLLDAGTAEPVLLPPNPVHRFYTGGPGIDALRGSGADSSSDAPEDWVASTSTSLGNESEGLATLADGRLLRDVIATGSRISARRTSSAGAPTRRS
jgi:hypothetical protein